MTFLTKPTVLQGNRTKEDTTNDTAESILGDILVELRIMNIHLSVLSDLSIQEEELD